MREGGKEGGTEKKGSVRVGRQRPYGIRIRTLASRR